MSLYAGIRASTRLSQSQSIAERAVGYVFQVFESRFGATVVASDSKAAISPMLAIAQRLQEKGIIRSCGRRMSLLPDEPPVFVWSAAYADDDSSAGASTLSDTQALASTLAEALERYLWRYDETPLSTSITASEKEMIRRGYSIITLQRFSGFSDEQRKKEKALMLTGDTSLCWCKARDITSGKSVYVPLQTLTAVHSHKMHHEALVRPVITTGLATGVTRENALIAGALEVIERDAFMIMWLNQLTYPRLNLMELAQENEELRALLHRAAQYSLTLSAVRMVTDAPAHAVLAVVEDEGARPHAPFIVGMGCRQSLADAAAHAILEALRIRVNARTHYVREDAARIVPKKIRHTERVPYWLHAERWHRLRFLNAGPVESVPPAAWEQERPALYLERLKRWCKEKKYSFLSYDLGRSKHNPTPWFVESVVIPELQPMHIVERYQCLGGKRLTEVPQMFGYTPREELFSEEPHPFA